jgi:hypothetical protein
VTQWGSQTPTCNASSSADGCLGGGNVGPQQLATDATGNVFVADTNHYRIQEFTGDGAYVTKFGAVAGCPPVCPIEPQQLALPFGVATERVAGSTAVMVSDQETEFLTLWVPAAAPGPPPAPVLGQSVDVAPLGGVILVKQPGGHMPDAHAGAVGSASGFVPLTQAQQIPTGSEIDASHGSLQITSATSKHGMTQSGVFGGALFKITQARAGRNKGLTTLSLLEGIYPGAPSYAVCPTATTDTTAHTARLSTRVLQLLRASEHGGRFSTRGRYSAATVRGTHWDTIDRCDGTLTVVHSGTVKVLDFVHHVTVTVTAGHRYLAKAPGRK